MIIGRGAWRVTGHSRRISGRLLRGCDVGVGLVFGLEAHSSFCERVAQTGKRGLRAAAPHLGQDISCTVFDEWRVGEVALRILACEFFTVETDGVPGQGCGFSGTWGLNR